MRLVIGILACGILGGGFLAAEPVIPGLHGKHPLSESSKGKVLLAELRCAACHKGIPGEMKMAPDLRTAGSRLSGDYLQQYIANPHGLNPGTTMPDVLAGLTEEKRREVSESISHYLRSLVAQDEVEKEEGDAGEGREIYHKVGCVACHSPRDDQGGELRDTGVISLKHVGAKYHEGALAQFLMDPLAVRPSGRMPNLKLTSSEAAALEAYLGGGRKMTREPATPEKVALGRANFEKYNCVACHDMGRAESKMGPKLEAMDLSQGCLTNEVANYQLDEGQIEEIKLALEKPVTLSDEEKIGMKLTQLNCIACHERDDFGGVAADIDEFFHTTEEALGDTARIPPPLTKLGGKLRPEWLDKVLYEGMSVRPYMKTRMPQYGRLALGGLPELVANVDELPAVELPPPDREERPMISNGGHLLLGSEGLNCISCHNYNGKESPAMKGYDLIWTYQRLQPGWYYRFMQDPAGHRPGIIMPNYWPGGEAVQTEILDGDTHEQLRALWYQFSLGRSARDPKGLVSKPNVLVVGDKVRVYRGRSRVAGYRGIAVGFPKGMNYAFNAQNGALSALWSGDFVTANWRSQGAGDFNPRERPVRLPEDVAFFQLENEDQQWPLKPVTTKENPVISDPLYPGNYGYAFRGYFFDGSGNPTFRYRCGEIDIAEQSQAKSATELHRQFTFQSPGAETIYFRVLAGEVTKESEGEFAIPGLNVSVGQAETMLRPSAAEGEQELLLKIPLEKGENNYSIDYELLR